MSRLLVFALAASLGNTSVVFAGDTLLASATRIVREAAQSESTPANSGMMTEHRASLAIDSQAAAWLNRAAPGALLTQQGQPSLAASGLKKRTKVAIVLGVAAAFVGSVWTIDSRVEDSTPSTLGTRKDNGSTPPK